MNTTYKGYVISRVKLKRHGEKGEPAVLIQVRKAETDTKEVLKSIVITKLTMNEISKAMKKCYRYIDKIETYNE